jgi:hypothetical protein
MPGDIMSESVGGFAGIFIIDQPEPEHVHSIIAYQMFELAAEYSLSPRNLPPIDLQTALEIERCLTAGMPLRQIKSMLRAWLIEKAGERPQG